MEKELSKDTLVGHLSELRNRLAIVLVVNIVAILVCFQFSDKAINYLLALNPGMQLVYIAPSELFMAYIKIAIICGVVLASPITMGQIFGFVSKGLYEKERRVTIVSMTMGVFFFALGVICCYYMVLPFILGFFMRMDIAEVTAMVSIQEYMSFINTMLLAFGIVFEMPVVVFALSWVGVLKPDHMRRFHGALVVIIFIVAAIVTPPDVVSQILMAVPMVLLLELSMVICNLVSKKRFPELATAAK